MNEIRSLSASAIETFEGCPRRFKATYIDDRPPEETSDAAGKGTVCHAVLEACVPDRISREAFIESLDVEYWRIFADKSNYADCLAMLDHWLEELPHDYFGPGRVVLAKEVKKRFLLPLAGGAKMPMTYIFDRVDKLPLSPSGFDIEVTDYKSYRAAMSKDDVEAKIQPGLYAVAAMLEYPEARTVWVTYDLLRYGRVTIGFSRHDLNGIWTYLRSVTQRILEATEWPETIGLDCRWCIRKHACETLARHATAQGTLAEVNDLEEAIERFFAIDAGRKAYSAMLDDLKAFIIDFCRENDIEALTTESDEPLRMKLGDSGSRKIDRVMAERVVGPELAGKHDMGSVTAVDKLLKSDLLTEEQKDRLSGLIRREYGGPTIKITKLKKKVSKA